MILPVLVGLGGVPARGVGPVLPIGQVSLTELQATQQARQQMEAGAAGAARPQMSPENAAPQPADAAAGAVAAQAPPAASGGILKYLPAYVLILLFTGLGVAAVGRPVRRLPPDGT